MRDPRPGEPAIIAGCLAGALLLSCVSGYVRVPWPASELFPYTPLGLLTRFDPALLAVENACTFHWAPGLQLGYFRTFLVTCLLESPFYLWIFRRAPARTRAAVLVLANFCTHPIVFFAFPCLFRRYLPSALLSEAFAAIAEALIVVGWIRARETATGARCASAAAITVLANLFSWQSGVYF